MSKSANTIFLPVFGGVALAVGLGYGIANRHYGKSRIETLEARLEQVEAQAGDARNAVATASAEVESAMADARAAAAQADAEAGRVAELEAAMAELRAASTANAGAIADAGPSVARADGPLGLGRVALAEEVAAWDKDVRPDGKGLPVGSGDVLTGEEIFAETCASCHGDFAEGVDNWPKLAGGMDTLADKDPLKTVGSYWPYLSTTWDYVNRSMPFGNAQSLSADEVYAMVAYILYSNDLVDEDFVLSNETFLDVEMPNANGFIVDDRIETEFSHWVGEPCMENCKEDVKVTMRAMVLDVTPEEETEAAPVPAVSETASVEAEAEAVSDAPAAAASADETAADDTVVASADPELIAAGERVFAKCKACHQVGEGASNRSGPVLNGIFGRSAASVDGFRYSRQIEAKAEEGLVWNHETLAAFLANPKGYIKGTRMSFVGLKNDADIDAVLAYLASFPEG